MTITVKKIALSEQHSLQSDNHHFVNENYLSLVGGVEVSCEVKLGTISMTIDELRQLKQEQILPLGQKTHEPVDIVLNQQVIARGELMSCDDYFAIKITEMPG